MKENKVLNFFKYLLLTVWGIMVLFPFYWMILSSIKSYGEYRMHCLLKTSVKPSLTYR